MITIEHLKKCFGSYVVFENVSLSIEQGSIFGLVGINGAGKSTLLRCISGVYAPEEGRILLDDEIVYDNSKVKENIMFVPDEPFASVYTKGTDLESTYSSYYPSFDHGLFNELLNDFQIDKNKRINTFSKGMKRRLYLALAFAVKPKILLLDEAFDGLDPAVRLKVKKILIKAVEEDKMTTIISSHALRELEDICDSYAILDNKHIISSGMLGENVNACFKVQMAFQEVKNKNDFAYLNPISCEIEGRVVTLVIRGKREDYQTLLEKNNPLFIDDLELNFEDFFISNVEDK